MAGAWCSARKLVVQSLALLCRHALGEPAKEQHVTDTDVALDVLVQCVFQQVEYLIRCVEAAQPWHAVERGDATPHCRVQWFPIGMGSPVNLDG